MPRKMTLISEDLLVVLYDEHLLGVPCRALIRNHRLEMSPPTLTKILNSYTEMLSVDGRVQDIVRASMFPIWLTGGEMVQPDNWLYRGLMPLGKWEMRQ